MKALTIKKLIEPIRKKMPRYGTEKLHLDIKDDLVKKDIKMGRDGFLKFARNHRLLVPKTRRCFITTDSKHFYHKSPNRIKSLIPAHAEQVFISDITYIKLQDKHQRKKTLFIKNEDANFAHTNQTHQYKSYKKLQSKLSEQQKGY